MYVVSNPAFCKKFTGHWPDTSQPGAFAPGKKDDGKMDQAEGLEEKLCVCPIIAVIGFGVSFINPLRNTRAIADLQRADGK